MALRLSFQLARTAFEQDFHFTFPGVEASILNVFVPPFISRPCDFSSLRPTSLADLSLLLSPSCFHLNTFVIIVYPNSSVHLLAFEDHNPSATLTDTFSLPLQINSGASPYESEDDFFTRTLSQDDSSLSGGKRSVSGVSFDISGRPRGKSESVVKPAS